jgi:hypothetical protein
MGSPRTNPSLVIPVSSNQAFLNPILTAGGLLDPVATHVHLFVQNIPLTPLTTLAELLASEASFTGYVPQVAKGWGPSYVGEDGRAEADAVAPLVWAGPVGGGGPTVYGVFLTNIANDQLTGCAAFDSPYPLTTDSNSLTFLLSSYFPGV